MKKLLLCSAMLAAFLKGVSQNFTLLTYDPSGDNTLPYVADIQALYYSIDNVHDSIWFKVQTYNAMDPNGDVGLMFGLDTNMVTTDGLQWQGNNHSMNYDLAYFIFQDAMSPNYYGYTYTSSGSSPITTTVERPDSFTFIINTRLSLLDPDGHFNLLFGSGAFDIYSSHSVYDDAPNAGYMTIPAPLGITNISQENSFTVYPNPADNLLFVKSTAEKIKELKLFDSTGQLIKQVSCNSFDISVDISVLVNGVYFCETIIANGSASRWNKWCIAR